MVRPYELYIRFLVTKGYEDLVELNTHLNELSIITIDQGYFDRIYNFVTDTVPKPTAKQIETQILEGDFLKWMKVLDVQELWLLDKRFRTQENAYLKLVYDIHCDPKLKLTINALLTKGLIYKDICQAINHKFSSLLKEEHVTIYEKFFWNPKRMTRSSWREYLEDCEEHEKASLFITLTEDLDTVKTYLGLPSRVNVPQSLQFLLVTAYTKARHYLALSTKEANEEARAWIDKIVTLSDKYEKHSKGDVEDFSKVLQMEFEYVDSEFPTPDIAALEDIKRKEEDIKPIEDPKKTKKEVKT